MARASHPDRRTPTVFLAGLMAAGVVAAGPAPTEPARRPSSSFNLISAAATAPQPGATAPSAGAALGPGKAVVQNPYSVPMIQNAGPLRSGR